MKIKAYFPETFVLSKPDFKRLEKLIRSKWQMAPSDEVDAGDILIEADSEGTINLPNDDFMHTDFI